MPWLLAFEQSIHRLWSGPASEGVAAIIPNNAVADSLMDEISQFIEENCEAQILDEEREIR